MPNQKKSILACKHFNEPNHNLQEHSEFTLCEQIRQQMTIEETRKLLKKRENFWILKLETLCQDGLNQ